MQSTNLIYTYLFTKVRMNMSCLDTYPHKNHICLWKWNKEIEIVVAAFEITYLPTYFLLFAK